MTVKECIEYVDSIEPNAYTEAQKAGWLSECEGKVYTALFLVQPYEFTPITAADSRVLALPAPYDRMYPRYLQAMIHYANGEYDRYANSMAVFNEVWAEANRWFGGDYDVTDRLRNRRFSATLNPAPGQQVIMEIPEGCAIVGGRIIVEQPYVVDAPRYYVMGSLAAGTYRGQGIDDNWYKFTLPTAMPEGSWLRLQVSAGKLYYTTDLTIPSLDTPITPWDSEGEPDVTPLDFSCVCQPWMDDPSVPVDAPIFLEERGTHPLPMLLADRGGSSLGLTVGPGYWNPRTGGAGKLAFTGHLLIPDEEWAYEDKYSSRRDARWRG